MGSFDDWLHGSIRSWREIKALQIEQREYATLARRYEPVQRAPGAAQFYFWGTQAVGKAVDQLASRAVLYFFGALLIFTGAITVGLLLAVVRYYADFVEAVEQLRTSDVEYQAARAGVARALALAEDLPEGAELRREHARTECAVGPPPRIEVAQVTAGWRGHGSERTSIVGDVSMTIAANSLVSIVDESGGGKITLVRVITGEVETTAGNVLLDEIPLAELTERQRFDTFTYVGDDSELLNISVRQNLLLADEESTDQNQWAALAAVGISDEVAAMVDGIDTLIGERGIKLSGGQRQRLLIARALLSDRPVMVLDEATSQVDVRNDAAIHETLRRLRAEKTIVTISHRLARVVNADNLVVLRDGVVMCVGHHGSLLRESAEYRRLFERQNPSRQAERRRLGVMANRSSGAPGPCSAPPSARLRAGWFRGCIG